MSEWGWVFFLGRVGILREGEGVLCRMMGERIEARSFVLNSIVWKFVGVVGVFVFVNWICFVIFTLSYVMILVASWDMAESNI